jgi:hypothetical protein
MRTAKFHVHFNSRREAHPVFHMTDKLCKSSLAGRFDLAGKVRITTDRDLAKAPEALKTAAMLVTSMQVPRENLRALPRALRSIHFSHLTTIHNRLDGKATCLEVLRHFYSPSIGPSPSIS